MSSSKVFSKHFKLGLIKGGQLAKMLVQSSLNYGISTRILDSDGDAPCRFICDEFVKGDCESEKDVYDFGRGLDLLTFEFENVNIDALKKLQAEGVKVYPTPDVLKIVQDKGLQKNFYVENHIATADFVLLDRREDLKNHRSMLPCVQKLRRAGYDGRGVLKMNSVEDFVDGFDASSILEKRIDFQMEISVIVARNVSGEIAVYPPTQMEAHPEKHQLEFLLSPAEILDSTQQEAEKIARHIAEALGLIGILAVEMFVTREGKVLVNEIAPRPHNSGHHTIEANMTSQFDQHLRAVLDLPLGSTRQKMPAAMVNLVGANGFEGVARYEGIEDILKIEGVYVHLYGKKITKPFRKMGHITILDLDLKRLKEKARWVKKIVKVLT